MKTVVLVPYRGDGGHRDRLWEFLLHGFWPQFGWPVCVGEHDVEGERFNRSAALNAAARQQAWDVAVIADADTWVPRGQLDAALALCVESGRLVSALHGVIEFDRDCTESMLAADFSERTLSVGAVRTDELAVQSSMLVVSRRLWDDIGGFDERFAGGWGGEDNAFWRAATILSGPPLRVPGFAFHLWHEPAAENVNRADRGYQANLARWHRYRVARNERQLRAVRNAS